MTTWDLLSPPSFDGVDVITAEFHDGNEPGWCLDVVIERVNDSAVVTSLRFIFVPRLGRPDREGLARPVVRTVDPDALVAAVLRELADQLSDGKDPIVEQRRHYWYPRSSVDDLERWSSARPARTGRGRPRVRDDEYLRAVAHAAIEAGRRAQPVRAAVAQAMHTLGFHKTPDDLSRARDGICLAREHGWLAPAAKSGDRRAPTAGSRFAEYEWTIGPSEPESGSPSERAGRRR